MARRSVRRHLGRSARSRRSEDIKRGRGEADSTASSVKVPVSARQLRWPRSMRLPRAARGCVRARVPTTSAEAHRARTQTKRAACQNIAAQEADHRHRSTGQHEPPQRRTDLSHRIDERRLGRAKDGPKIPARRSGYQVKQVTALIPSANARGMVRSGCSTSPLAERAVSIPMNANIARITARPRPVPLTAPDRWKLPAWIEKAPTRTKIRSGAIFSMVVALTRRMPRVTPAMLTRAMPPMVPTMISACADALNGSGNRLAPNLPEPQQSRPRPVRPKPQQCAGDVAGERAECSFDYPYAPPLLGMRLPLRRNRLPPTPPTAHTRGWPTVRTGRCWQQAPPVRQKLKRRLLC